MKLSTNLTNMGHSFTLVLFSFGLLQPQLLARPEIGVEAAINIFTKDHNAVLKDFGADADNYQKRSIYFFDTEKHDLFKKGVILRLQLDHSQKKGAFKRATSTVKFRAAFPEKVDREIFIDQIIAKIPSVLFANGLKCEIDIILNEDRDKASEAFSCSYKVNINLATALGIINARKDYLSLFTETQLAFLKALLPADVVISNDGLEHFGPVDVSVWDVSKLKDLYTFELWVLPGNEKSFSLFQVSYKFPNEVIDTELEAFKTVLEQEELNFYRPLSKTRFVLENYRWARLEQIVDDLKKKNAKNKGNTP